MESRKSATNANVIPMTIETPIFSDSPKLQLPIANQCTTSKKANEYTRRKIPSHKAQSDPKTFAILTSNNKS